jgi:hypothetical protein
MTVMRRCRFVAPNTDRLDFTEDEWIEVKRELTTGETRAMYAQMFTEGAFDPRRVAVARILAYVVEWSLLDLAGRPAPLSLSAVDGLDAETFRELREAIDAHEARQEQAREAQKKTRSSGATVSDPTLQSVA